MEYTIEKALSLFDESDVRYKESDEAKNLLNDLESIGENGEKWSRACVKIDRKRNRAMSLRNKACKVMKRLIKDDPKNLEVLKKRGAFDRDYEKSLMKDFHKWTDEDLLININYFGG